MIIVQYLQQLHSALKVVTATEVKFAESYIRGKKAELKAHINPRPCRNLSAFGRN